MGKNIYHKFREPNRITPLNYGVIEQNLYALILCKLSIQTWLEMKKKAPVNSNRGMSFSILELTDCFKCSVSNLTNNVASAAKEMVTKELLFSSDTKDERFQLLESVEYHSNSGLDVKISKRAMELLRGEISKNYSEIDVKHYLILKSKYSKRLLKILSQWKGIDSKVLTMDLDEYKEKLGVPKGSYSRTESFVRNCIEKPIQEIIDNSDGTLKAIDDNKKGYVLHRKGRSFKTIQLTLKIMSEDDKLVEAISSL